MYQLVLVRHGQTGHNSEGRMQGHIDTDLSPVGREQARRVAAVIADMRPAAIISSDLKRAAHTGEAIAEACGLTMTVDERLRETHLGQWQGRTRDDIDAEFPGMRARWRNDALWAPEGAETQLQVGRRGRAVIDELVTSSPLWERGPIVIVAHGGFHVALTSDLLRIPPALRPIIAPLSNCGFAELTGRDPHDGSPGVTWTITSWNRSAPGNDNGPAGGVFDTGVQ